MKREVSKSLIFTVVFIDLLGFGLLIPLLPTFAKNVLHVDELAVGAAIAIYSLTQFFFNPIFGNLSDRYGRRKIIIITLFLNFLGYLLFSFTTSFAILLISRIIAGIGGSSIGVAQAYMADITTKETRSKGMGLIGAAFALGFVFGPFLGGFLSQYGYQVTGFVSAGFSLLAFMATFFLLPESIKKEFTPPRNRSLSVTSFKKLFSNPSLAAGVSIFFMLTFSIANIYGTFALIGNQAYHFTDLQNGYIYTIMGIASAVVQGGASSMSKRFSERSFITFGAFFMTIGLALIPYGNTFGYLAVVVCILSLGTGTMQPTLLALISKSAPENEQGMILGLNQSFSALARVLGPLWGGFSFEMLDIHIPFLSGALFSFLIFIFSIFYLNKLLHHKV